MAWTGTLNNIVKENGALSVSIVYSDGVTKFVKFYSLNSVSDDAIKEIASSEVDRLNALDDSLAKVTIAQNEEIAAVAKPVEQPADTGRMAFITEYRKWEALSRGLAAGLVKQEAVDAQRKVMQAAYSPDYESWL